MSRRVIVTAFLLLSAVAAAADVLSYPNQPIKLVQGFPAGGNVDVLARIMGEEMSQGLGQPVVIEARPGAVGSIAAEMIARSPPDGYRLLFLPSAHAVTAALYKSIKYHAVDDFTWISTVSFYPFVMVARADSKLQSLAGLLQEARANPGRLRYGSTGIGSIHHMTLELLARATGNQVHQHSLSRGRPRNYRIADRRHRFRDLHRDRGAAADRGGGAACPGCHQQGALAGPSGRADLR
jgi:tripartite-type tricarboxylate transporter receptor subunit TctC